MFLEIGKEYSTLLQGRKKLLTLDSREMTQRLRIRYKSKGALLKESTHPPR
ncbi:MAG: hypothetical protein RBR16_08060 [Syntrophus sp. (in: bacteria)]|nr:hypothetical protein [Syntrophus sp. (in: bacteria)]